MLHIASQSYSHIWVKIPRKYFWDSQTKQDETNLLLLLVYYQFLILNI